MHGETVKFKNLVQEFGFSYRAYKIDVYLLFCLATGPILSPKRRVLIFVLKKSDPNR